MDLIKKRWLNLGASCLINLCIGSLYAWSVFMEPMAEYLSAVTGKITSNLSIVFTIANSAGPITMISGGAFNDRLGPRRITFIGGILFGGGMFFSGFVDSVAELVFWYGIGLGLGVGMVYGSTVSNVVKFFPDRRGFAGGLACASYGISSVIIPPVANMLIRAFGVTTTFKILGLFMLAIISIASAFIVRCPPEFTLEYPEPLRSDTDQSLKKDKDWKGMLADPAFYVMLLLLCCGAFSGLMVISRASPVAQSMIGMSIAAAAVAVSALAFFNTCGRIIAGFLSDKFGIVKTLLGVFILSIVGLVILCFSETGDVLRFYTGIACVGLAFGSIMGIFPGFTAARFGSKNNSVNYGIMFIGFAAAGYFGPGIMSGIYAGSGSYQPAFLTAIGLAIAGLVLILIYRKLEAVIS